MVSETQSDAIREIDRALERVGRELAKAQEAAQKIPGLTALLASLEQTRVYLTGSNGSESRPTPAIFRSPVAAPLTEITLGILRASTEPMTVDQIMDLVKQTAPDARRFTILGHLSRFVERGLARRTAPATYEAIREVAVKQ